MFVYAVLALGWASSAWPQGFSSYVPRYIAQPFAPTSDETCKTCSFTHTVALALWSPQTLSLAIKTP